MIIRIKNIQTTEEAFQAIRGLSRMYDIDLSIIEKKDFKEKRNQIDILKHEVIQLKSKINTLKNKIEALTKPFDLNSIKTKVSCLDILENEAKEILLKSIETDAVLSFSGGADSTIMHHIMQKYNIPINEIFINSYVENKYNKKIIKQVIKQYDVVYNAKTRSYKEIVYEFGFPIGNKNFSHICYRLYRNRLSINNVVDKFRIITGVSPYQLEKIKKGNNISIYSLEAKFWYLALNYPIQSYCCNILKKQPAKKLKKDMIVGIMRDDSLNRRKAISMNFHGKYFPLQSWTKKDIFEYTKREGIELSKIYEDRDIEINGEKITLCGASGSGCPACDFGQNDNHFIIVDGKKIKTTKFHKLKLEFPKLYEYSMKMKHKSGVDFKEVITVHRACKKDEDKYYTNLGIKLRSNYAKQVKKFLKLKGDVPKEAFELLDTYITD